MRAVQSVFVLLIAASSVYSSEVKPFPRALLDTPPVKQWSFDNSTEGWSATNDCSISADDGVLRIESSGNDPYLTARLAPEGSKEAESLHEGPLVARIRAKGTAVGSGRFYWATDKDPNTNEKKVASFDFVQDGEWREYDVPLGVEGKMTLLRLDPCGGPGTVEVDRISLQPRKLHPVEIEWVWTSGDEVRLQLKNHSDNRYYCKVNGNRIVLAGRQVRRMQFRAEGDAPCREVPIKVEIPGVNPVERTVFVYDNNARAQWLTLERKGLTYRVSRDGTAAEVLRDGKPVALLAPIVAVEGVVPELKLVRKEDPFRFRGDGVTVEMSLATDGLSVSIDSDRQCEGPVLRALGRLEQGLLSGLEYLGEGEGSSSTLDITTDEHLRWKPDPMKVTIPLMACVTDRCGAAITWSDMSLQPIFATPNFLDGSNDHRMALRGRKIDATISVRPAPLEDFILWSVEHHGLPPVPKPPRSHEEQLALAVKALEGPIRQDGGWSHCAEGPPRWKPRWFADMASTLWRITGKAPDLPRLVPGGGHVPNAAIYFVTGHASEWLRRRRNVARGKTRAQRPDGSFRYNGKFRRGHFENTASGFCARSTTELLEVARMTGDKAALRAGVKGLEYMKRFRTPRGAQIWELSLHTPDQLASAYLVWAYTRGYELTGNKEYLRLARKWALTGLPFTYLWGRYPVMVYGTTPVFGATHFVAPNWMGLPVQWVGGVYAYALNILAEHDDTLDWNHIARGILVAGEQMIHPDGKFIGCLPDSFSLRSQRRNPAMINPCAFTSLRLVLEGKLDGLAVAEGNGHIAVAPFPVEIRGDAVHIEAKRGTSYQVVIDGERVVDVESKGSDRVPLN